MKEEVGIGHCGKGCPNWICEELKLDDLCQGCPCNEEEDDDSSDPEDEEEE